MAELPPHAVLSEHFQERMSGRRSRSAVFLTYQLDPGFFEQEVLPVFLDISLSHATPIRLVQLEDALRTLPGQVAVYYDANGLVAGSIGSAKLDVRRIPVRHRTGIFHPKNLFLLVENEEADEQGYRSQALLFACLSANLTRSGWWENVEACYVEEIGEGDKTRLKDDVVAFLERLRRKAPADGDHAALREILAFLKSTNQGLQKSANGRLYTHFYSGNESIADFLERTAGNHIRGCYLEIISPYFDDAEESKPLLVMRERFQPKEVRVYLPRSPAGEVLCRQELFESVCALPRVKWGRLPKDILKLGRSEDAGERFVHAKVYRFFTQNPKRETCFIGSANLTSAAHQTGGNVETGFLVDTVPSRRPEFWLAADDPRPTEFCARKEDEPSATSGGIPLVLRYHWDTARAEAFWDASAESPELRLEARGILLGVLPVLPSRVWTVLPPEIARQVGCTLEETSLFDVHDGDRISYLLVQEEGMSHKPSVLLSLSASDILRYWSLLTAEQRAAFLEARAPEIALTREGAELVAKTKVAVEVETIFNRFAGFFHAFGCLERAVRAALDGGKDKEATYRLFGRKYDSLGSLLDRVAAETNAGDTVDHYVIVMCARQLCQQVAKDFPGYWGEHKADAKILGNRFKELERVRAQLLASNPENFAEFLQWFDRWFLHRAAPAREGQP